MEQAINSGITVKRDEVLVKNKENKTTPIGISISPITDIKDKFSGCVAIFKDLSEIRRLEEKLRQAEKLSYLGKMASWVAHEIRNPLTAIDGFAQLLNNKAKQEKIGLYSSEIRKGTERINYIIDDILCFARTKRKVTHVEINLRELIQSIIKGIVHIKITISGDKSSIIKGEIESIRRVFVNLINNSAEAMGEDGRLKINFSSNKKMILTEIIDNGKGIPKENLM
ncbi:Sporulation kinase A [subsurface metagenome]